MKELLLIRHAKSDWGHPGLDDHDRPLNGRGLRDAPRVGRELAGRGIRPEAMVSSTALRALTTARLMAREWGFAEEAIDQRRALYLPRPDEVLGVIRDLDESLSTAVLFGHNPGFHETAWSLARPVDRGGLEDFPTCAVARFRLPVECWGLADFGEGELIEFLFPKAL